MTTEPHPYAGRLAEIKAELEAMLVDARSWTCPHPHGSQGQWDYNDFVRQLDMACRDIARPIAVAKTWDDAWPPRPVVEAPAQPKAKRGRPRKPAPEPPKPIVVGSIVRVSAEAAPRYAEVLKSQSLPHGLRSMRVDEVRGEGRHASAMLSVPGLTSPAYLSIKDLEHDPDPDLTLLPTTATPAPVEAL